jgi:hypothetical protein
MNVWDVWRQLGDSNLIAAPPHTFQLREEVVLVALAAAVHKQFASSLNK